MKGRVNTKEDPLRMHVHPFLEARVIGHLDKGAIVEILDVKKGWFRVKTELVGWVDSDFMQELPPPQPDSFPAPCSIEPVGTDWIERAWQWVWILFCLVVVGWLASAALSFVGII